MQNRALKSKVPIDEFRLCQKEQPRKILNAKKVQPQKILGAKNVQPQKNLSAKNVQQLYAAHLLAL